MKKGKLVRVKIGNRVVKMYEGDLENKGKKPAGNKIKTKPVETKATIEPGSDDPTVFDDLTAINGVGKASQRALNENGIFTFDQLAVAAADGNIGFLGPKTIENVLIWVEERSEGE